MRSRLLHPWTLALASLVSLASGSMSKAESPTIRLSEAGQSGVFNVGNGQGTYRLVEPKDVEGALKFDYTLPVGTAAGLWAKNFPPGFDAEHLDLAQVGIRGVGPDAAKRVNASLELKGTAGTQKIALDLGPPSATTEHRIQWATIGRLNEVVVAVGQTGAEPASGSIVLDIRFEPLPWPRKLAESMPGRFAVILGFGLLMTLLWKFATRFLGESRTVADQPRLLRDFFQGSGTVAIAVLSLWIFELGGKDPSINILEAVLATGLGVGVIGWWKTGLTGRFLTPVEVFLDTLAIGLLAASSSPLLILQAPGNWSQAFQLSQTAASVAAFVYLAFVASRLSTTGRHPGAIEAGLIVGTPYLFGSLVLLSSPKMTQAIGGLSLGFPREASAILGRVVVLFLFNEAVAQGLSLATKRKLLKSIPAHLALVAVSLVAAVAPNFADLGSGDAEAAKYGALGRLVTAVADWNRLGRLVVSVVSTMFSQAGLWGEVYLVTGLLLDAIHGGAPTRSSTFDNPFLGVKKGMVFSGTYMALLYGLGWLGELSVARRLVEEVPWLVAVVFSTLAFPLVKTIFETFDGSKGFYRRVLRSYTNPWLYARGAVVGLALGVGLTVGISGQSITTRAWFGFSFGLAAYAGINLLGDIFEASRDRGQVLSWKVYFVQGMLGGFIGAALAFYFDQTQVSIVVAKFHEYLSFGHDPKTYDLRTFVSQWGYINLGTQTGGVKLLFDEALAGVIEWAVPAWMFAINARFMAAFFQKEAAPIKNLFSKEGMTGLTQNMIMVFRWGLWMSPIVKSFLRPMGDPTWYNQDGAIRTLFAIFHDATTSPDAFRTWSFDVFVTVLAYDAFRLLIWVDHMGLRVATLVNLSFMGMDKLDARVSKFVAPASTSRFIPEGVKRFTTWAPLLIPFYIPQGKSWDLAWQEHIDIQQTNGGGQILAPLLDLSTGGQLLVVAVGLVACTGSFSLIRWFRERKGENAPPLLSIANTEYEVTLTSTGEVRSTTRGFDVTRRSYDFLDPAGRALFVVDRGAEHAWPVVGNFPGEPNAVSRLERGNDCIRISSEARGLKTTVEIRTAGPGDPAEIWEITVENLVDWERDIKLVPYLEWVLNKPGDDRSHTQYNRLFAEMEYAQGLHAVLAWDKHAKALGVLTADVTPEGFLTSRVDFIGRVRSLWHARALETLAFSDHQDTDAHPTFDPIGALLLPLKLEPRTTTRIRLLIGLVTDKKAAIELIARHLQIPGAASHPVERKRKAVHAIRHGEIPPGTPQPYYEFLDGGRTLRVLTPFTPRPFDHALSNTLGQLTTVTNRGLHTSASWNSQQNQLTPDWPDMVTREVPSEAFYLYDLDTEDWYSPTYQPLNDSRANYVCDFSVDGTATFHMTRGSVETELTVFVPPDEPVTIYRLTIRNPSDQPRRFRVAPYFQIVLASQPENAGPLEIRPVVAQWLYDPENPVRGRVDPRNKPNPNALIFRNPRNTFRTGPAFVSISKHHQLFQSRHPEALVTSRGQFFGPNRDVTRPSFVSSGVAAEDQADDQPVAGFLTTLEIPAAGESSIVVVLGQADTETAAERMLLKYQPTPTVYDFKNQFGELSSDAPPPKIAGLDAAHASLEATRSWWTSLMDTVRVETSRPEFDGYLDWLKYQALAERIWARRGFYQASGAFGFRDQLQDSVNLIWMDPALARKQILLHASQQFLEGDVVHWFHRLQDGRTGFVARTHASDNLLWLAWGVVEYVGATGDVSLLDERTPYLESELPFPPLPANKEGMGFDPLRSSREDSVYRHAMKAIDRVLDHKMGAHALPLIGTGDWNDGLDEIGSQGRGESIWLGFFLYYILERMAPIVGRKEGDARQDHYLGKLRELGEALESTWRDDRYLRAIHDDGTEIGVKGAGIGEIDALTAAWAVMAGINPGRGRIVYETALGILEKDTTILLGWPPLREDTKPYLGRSSAYPEGVRENGMYCHGVQWLVGAARLLSNQAASEGRIDDARKYREDAYRLWRKISPLDHVGPDEIETYGGQPNKQAADMVTTFDPGRMIWNGYTGAAGWMFRQAIESVLGYRLIDGKVQTPPDSEATPSELGEASLTRNLQQSPFVPSEPKPVAAEL